MRLPTPLLRQNKKAYKNIYGHVLVLAGSRQMIGAAALTGLAAMRSGAGLVTIGIPKSLNAVLHKKVSSTIMSLPLAETPEQTLSHKAFDEITRQIKKYNSLAIGPGLSQNTNTQRFILKVIENVKQPLVIDADALNAVSGNIRSLTKISNIKVLTPHPGEMARLISLPKAYIEGHRQAVAKDFAKTHKVILLLKGHETVVASPDGKVFINKTGNPGMATAGSGDVLTGIIAALAAQGLNGFEAAKWGAYLHGLAGDLAAHDIGPASLIATDIIEYIPKAIKKSKYARFTREIN